MQNCIILDAGAIGSLLGAYLSENKNNKITLIGTKHHVNTARKKGLQIRGLTNKPYHLDIQVYIEEIPKNTTLMGALLKVGKSHHVDMPRNRALYEAVKTKEQE